MWTRSLATTLIGVVLGCVGVTGAVGMTYHVDGDNENVGDGSLMNPFATIEAGLAAATQGDKVAVHKVDGVVGPRGTEWGHYLLTAAITVEAGETLELDPGVVVKFKYLTKKDTNPGMVQSTA